MNINSLQKVRLKLKLTSKNWFFYNFSKLNQVKKIKFCEINLKFQVHEINYSRDYFVTFNNLIRR